MEDVFKIQKFPVMLGPHMKYTTLEKVYLKFIDMSLNYTYFGSNFITPIVLTIVKTKGVR